jgi:3-(3-hydroxy-phenyl)propionate hydroxylase
MSINEFPDEVVVVGAGPVGCAAALLLAQRGVPVTILERHLEPHPLPRAVHLDDEVLRILHRVGVAEDFLSRSRPATGLRLLDGDHKVLAEFPRPTTVSDNGFPYANMFHQPDLEALLLDRVERHPLITLCRGLEVEEIGSDPEPSLASQVAVSARGVNDGTLRMITGRFVLGCDGANSTVRDLLGVEMDDLKFTERWLVVDVRTAAELDPWGCIDQICDPARPATFMRVVGDRYRWEFQLQDGESEADLVVPDVLGRLLRPWTGRNDLDGLEIVRSATYTFRARLARQFQVGSVFLLGDAAHLTPPFIGQGLGAGLRDAGNLAWKVADVLDGRAHPEVLSTYESERRPHSRALVQRAVRVGWAMTGGQDRAAGVRRVALALAVRSRHVREAIARPATPPLRRGALDRGWRQWLSRVRQRPHVGGLLPNPLVYDGAASPRRLEDVIAGRLTVLTGARPSRALVETCRTQDLRLVCLHPQSGGDVVPTFDDHRVDVRLAEQSDALTALVRNPTLHLVVRPDGVVAAIGRGRPLTIPRAITCPTPQPARQLVVAG